MAILHHQYSGGVSLPGGERLRRRLQPRHGLSRKYLHEHQQHVSAQLHKGFRSFCSRLDSRIRLATHHAYALPRQFFGTVFAAHDHQAGISCSNFDLASPLGSDDMSAALAEWSRSNACISSLISKYVRLSLFDLTRVTLHGGELCVDSSFSTVRRAATSDGRATRR